MFADEPKAKQPGPAPTPEEKVDSIGVEIEFPSGTAYTDKDGRIIDPERENPIDIESMDLWRIWLDELVDDLTKSPPLDPWKVAALQMRGRSLIDDGDGAKGDAERRRRIQGSGRGVLDRRL